MSTETPKVKIHPNVRARRLEDEAARRLFDLDPAVVSVTMESGRTIARVSFVACEHGHPERPAGESCGPCDDAFAAGLR